MTDTIELKTRLTCPECGHAHQVTMSETSCTIVHECESCQAVLKPREGDCCVYCSYGTVPCPSIQREWENGQLGMCCSGE